MPDIYSNLQNPWTLFYRTLACTPVFEPGGERLPAPSFEEQRTSMIAAAWKNEDRGQMLFAVDGNFYISPTHTQCPH